MHEDTPQAWTVPWDAFPSEEEAEALTRDNPKGRLFEFCQRIKCGRPKLTLERKGTVWGVGMLLRLRERELDSGMQWAWDRKLAEQMAARSLLGRLSGEDEGEPGEEVTAGEEERLCTENPKGALLERCTVLRMVPVLNVRPIVTDKGPSFEASAYVVLSNGEEVWSEIRRASNAKGAEQAVAHSLLKRLEEENTAAQKTESMAVFTRLEGEPRSILNELRQKGRLRDYGFSIDRINGPPHAPIFRMSGYAERSSGERLVVEAIEARSKKEGEKLVAQRLVERVLG